MAKLQKGVNDLKTWCLANGDFGRKLLNEWTGECDDGKHYKIDEVARGSKKKFKWRCTKEHEWYASVGSRVPRHTGCPHCCTYGTSYPEQFICRCLEQLYPSTVNRCRVLKSPQNTQGIEFDIGIPDIPLCIEYSPTAWHKDKQERDEYKKKICEQAGVRLIQIIEDSYGELEPRMENDYICFRMDPNKQDEILVYIVAHILKSLGRSISEIDIETAKKNAWEYSRGKIEHEKSLIHTHQKLVEEWHPTLNDNVKPNQITYGSNQKVYWTCPKCNYGANGEWHTTAHTRVHQKSGCARCGYNWSDGKIHKTHGSTIANKGVDDLQSQYPELAKEWHPTLNDDLTPDEITCGSNKKIYWQCQKCSYGSKGEWQAPPVRRTAKGYETGCRNCGYNWSDGRIHKTCGSTAIRKGVNDLQSQHPELAKEWHPTLNGNLKPDQITCGSSAKVYWQCPKCNHGVTGEWCTTVNKRTFHKSGCSRCGHNWYKAQRGLPQKYKGLYSYLNDQENP